MSSRDDNNAILGRWFTDFRGKTCDLSVVDEIAAPGMLLKYSPHAPREGGRADITALMTDFRAAFPHLNFRGTADLIAEGDFRRRRRRRHAYRPCRHGLSCRRVARQHWAEDALPGVTAC